MRGVLAVVVWLAVSATAWAQPFGSASTVSIRSAYGGYLSAYLGGGFWVDTRSTSLGPWETFQLVPIPAHGQFFISTDRGALLQDHGTLVTADRNTVNPILVQWVYSNLYYLRRSDGLYWCATSTGTVFSDYSAPPSWCYWRIQVIGG